MKRLLLTMVVLDLWVTYMRFLFWWAKGPMNDPRTQRAWATFLYKHVQQYDPPPTLYGWETARA